MYVATLGAATKKCTSPNQRAEALRLCNCKRYGYPEGKVSGLGQSPRSDADVSISITATGPSNPCDPTLRVPMPTDFNPNDPCEAASRLTCIQQAAREQEAKREAERQAELEAEAEEQKSYESSVLAREKLKQGLLVGGLLAAVLVGGGFVVYRARKG